MTLCSPSTSCYMLQADPAGAPGPALVQNISSASIMHEEQLPGTSQLLVGAAAGAGAGQAQQAQLVQVGDVPLVCPEPPLLCVSILLASRSSMHLLCCCLPAASCQAGAAAAAAGKPHQLPCCVLHDCLSSSSNNTAAGVTGHSKCSCKGREPDSWLVASWQQSLSLQQDLAARQMDQQAVQQPIRFIPSW